VEVTGTVFVVRHRRQRTDVEVLQGSVRVRTHQRGPLEVAAGQRLEGNATTPTPLDSRRRRRLWRRADTLSVLSADEPATLEILSTPTRARVSVDGVFMGYTPVAMALKPGHRRLEVGRAGRIPVREHLLLRFASALRRDFELDPTPADADTGASAGTGTRAGAGTAPAPRAEAIPADPTPPALPHRRAHPGASRKAGPPGGGWKTLLSRAQARRAAQDWAGAVRAYGALIRRYPTRPESATARVSLGFIQLEHLGQPGRALRSFDRYLRRGGRGPVAREAAWGRIRALRALGRRAEERRALRRYLKQYAGSVHSRHIRRRLRELEP
jgi:hypothetical protein